MAKEILKNCGGLKPPKLIPRRKDDKETTKKTVKKTGKKSK